MAGHFVTASTTLSRRRLLRHGAMVGAALIPGLSLSGALANAATQRDITLRVATAKGDITDFFADARQNQFPYHVSYANFPAGALSLQALASNALDYAKMSETAPVFIAQKRPPLRIVGLIKGDPSIITLLVPGKSQARQIGDLKGKTVGYTSATNAHYFLLRLLREQGLAFKDVQAVNLTPQDGLAAFQSGRLDAWSTWGVFGQLAVNNAAGRVMRNGKGVLSSNLLVVANLQAIDDTKNEAVVRDYLLRERAVIEWINQHQQQWAERTAKFLALPVELVLDPVRRNGGWGHMVPIDDEAVSSQQDVADAFSDIGLIDKHVDVRALWDRRFNPALL